MDKNKRQDSVISSNYEASSSKTNSSINLTWDVYIYTACIIVLGFNQSMTSGLFAPAMVDFQYMFHTSLNKASLVNVFRNVGNIIGCAFGFTYDRLNRQMIILIMGGVIGLTTILIPFCSDLWHIYLSTTLSYIAQNAIDCGVTVWLVEMWGHKSASILQLNKGFHGVGSILAPLIDGPYIVGELEPSNITQYHDNKTAIQLAKDELNYSIERRSKLEIPFLISGLLTLPIPVIMLAMFIIKRYRPPQVDEKDKVVDASKPVLSPKVKYSLIALIAINLSFFAGMELLHQSYSSTYYQKIPLHLSAQKSAQILSVVSATLTLGKFISSLLSIKLKPEYTLMYSYVLIAIAMVILYFGRNNELAIWIGNAIIGLGFAAPWVTYFSLTAEHLGLTNITSAIFMATAAVCPMISPLICGPYIAKFPDIFLIVEWAYFGLTLITSAIIMFIIKAIQRSHRNIHIYPVNSITNDFINNNDCKY